MESLGRWTELRNCVQQFSEMVTGLKKKKGNIIAHLHLFSLYLVYLGVYEFRGASRDILLSVPHCFQNQLYKHGHVYQV